MASTAFYANAIRSTFVKPGVPLRLGSRRTNGISGCYHPDKSAVAQNNIELGHRNQCQETRFLVMRTGRLERIISKESEIEFHPDNMNREESFSLSKSWIGG
jgi:hypothetical protein